jgi:hypothetical protein
VLCDDFGVGQITAIDIRRIEGLPQQSGSGSLTVFPASRQQHPPPQQPRLLGSAQVPQTRTPYIAIQHKLSFHALYGRRALSDPQSEDGQPHIAEEERPVHLRLSLVASRVSYCPQKKGGRGDKKRHCT